MVVVVMDAGPLSSLSCHITPDAAEDLAADLRYAATKARQNERRCGTCAYCLAEPDRRCIWGRDAMVRPTWLAHGMVVGADDGHECRTWTRAAVTEEE